MIAVQFLEPHTNSIACLERKLINPDVENVTRTSKLRSRLNGKLKLFKNMTSVSTTMPNELVRPSGQGMAADNQSGMAVLKLRIFKEWYSSFLTAIHDNPTLPKPKENLLQPLTYATGEAKSAVAGCVPTDGAYEKVVRKLQDRFGDPNRLI